MFTFARLRYDAAPRPASARRGGWTTDLPDADHFEELPIEHPLYRMIFHIREKAQVPN